MTATSTPSRIPAVLLVEDDIRLLTVTRERFESLGCRVIGATGAESALELFQSESVDFVFTDLMMPRVSGEILLEQLLQLDPRVKLVAASASSQELDRVQQRWGNRVRYLMKPYSREELVGLLALEAGHAVSAGARH